MAEKPPYEYDLFVIGGGSGGLTAAKRAARAGKRVGVADFVVASPPGTTWGIGGTCLNVGCIPKKLMHYAALLGEARRDQSACGWPINEESHSWERMVSSVTSHIRASNWSIRKSLNENGIKYFNAFARFVDPHTIALKDKKGIETCVTAENIVIAVGGRPVYPETEGARECCITSDDLFWLARSPGKTLVIGAGYIGLECGGFLTGLGCEVEVLHRGAVLSSFDEDLAQRVREYMEDLGTRFTKGVATHFAREGDRVRVTKSLADGAGEVTEEYDTVLLAQGRRACLAALDLQNVGLAPNAQGKLVVSERWQTAVPHIFAIGDATDKNRELTPVAIKEAQYLIRGLYEGDWRRIDYDTIPTAVFTPLEYAVCGLGEREAIARYGEEAIDVYHSAFKPLEWSYLSERKGTCYCKVVVSIADRRVLGVHFIGPNAGEVISGFAVLVRKGAVFEDLQETIGIHPTIGEELVNLELTKRESPIAEKEDC